uniref:ANK_REP_REGION domain-containing protein n=1 Tax=Globodera pallida TaxID=36090 RepID=A0A183CE19_GLOPA
MAQSDLTSNNFFDMATKGDADQLRSLLGEQSSADEVKRLVNAKNADGATGLMVAAEKGHAKVVTFLLEKGANPNETCTRKIAGIEMGVDDSHE